MASICDSVLDAVDDFVDIADRALTRLRILKPPGGSPPSWGQPLHHRGHQGILVETSTRSRTVKVTWSDEQKPRTSLEKNGTAPIGEKSGVSLDSLHNAQSASRRAPSPRGRTLHTVPSRTHVEKPDTLSPKVNTPSTRNAYRKLDEIFNGKESTPNRRLGAETVDFDKRTTVFVSKPLPPPPPPAATAAVTTPKARTRERSPAKLTKLTRPPISVCGSQKELPIQPRGRPTSGRAETAPSSWWKNSGVKVEPTPKDKQPNSSPLSPDSSATRARLRKAHPPRPRSAPPKSDTLDKFQRWIPDLPPKPPTRRYSFVEDAKASATTNVQLPRSTTPPGLRMARSATPLVTQKPVIGSSPGFRGVSLKVEELRPDLEKCDVLVIAIAEMEICKEIFAGWKAQLDLAEFDVRRGDKLEASIITAVEKLNTGANAALQSSHAILHLYQSITRTMERRLNEISKLPSYKSHSGGGLLFPPHTASELKANSAALAAHSQSLSAHVQRMQALLRQLVSDLEATKEGATRRALRCKIWLWIARVFRALSMLLSAGGAVLALVYPVGFLETTAIAGASMFSGAVARLCELAREKYSDTRLDAILAFLRSSVPESAQAAFLALTSFQACHRVLRLELEVREGKRHPPWVGTREAAAAKVEWGRASEKLGVYERGTEGDKFNSLKSYKRM